MAVDYYVNRPVDQAQLNSNLTNYVDQLIAYFLSKGTTEGIKLFIQTFGPASTAQFIFNVQRNGDQLSVEGNTIAGIDFATGQITQAAITNIVADYLEPWILRALGGAAAGAAIPGVAYIAAGTVGVAVVNLVWNNILQPAYQDAKEYMGIAPARVEATSLDGQFLSGLRFSLGLIGDGFTEIDAVKWLLRRISFNPGDRQPDIGTRVRVYNNDNQVNTYDLLQPDVLQKIATPVGFQATDVANWNWGSDAAGISASNGTLLVPSDGNQFSILQTGAKLALFLPNYGLGSPSTLPAGRFVALPQDAIYISGDSRKIDLNSPLVAAFGSSQTDILNLSQFNRVYAYGGLGADLITGDIGDDVLWGDIANDPIGGDGDIISGGDGNDTILGGGGDDKIHGG
jgi:hypothetical protein